MGVLAGFYEEFRDVADADAHVSFDVADAFAAHALRLAASADHGAELVILLQPVGQMLHGDGPRRAVDGFLHRDDVHADARAAGRDELGRQLQGFLGRQIEHRRHFRVRVGEGGVLHHVFAGAYDPLGDPVLDMLIRVVAVLFDDADPKQVVDDLLRFFLGHIVALRQLRGRQTAAALFEAEHELDFFLCQQPVEDPEIHVVFLHAAGQLAGNIVRDHAREL